MTETSLQLRFPVRAQGIIRVLHVRTVCGNGGGPEKTIFRGADYLPALGVEAEALYLLDAHAPADALRAMGAAASMPVHFVTEKSALDASGASALARLTRHDRFDIVHTHDYKANALARLLASTASYRIVATAHGYNQTTVREGCYYALEKLLLRRADAVICPSQPLLELLADSGVSRRRLCLIPNGIELDRWPFQPRRQRAGAGRLLYVGRLSREKNVSALLDATALLVSRRHAVRLEVAGDGPEHDRLTERIDALGLSAAARLLGHREDVLDLLAAADVLVNPSLAEAMPNSVLEALACGAPVVATDVGATGELVLHEQTGLLTPPGDAEAMAWAVERLLAAPDFAQALAVRGRSHVEEKFDFATRMAHVVAVYRGVLAMARRCA